MAIQIVGSFDRDTIYCAGSLTKLLTTYVSLSLLSEKYDLKKIVDDNDFLETLATDSSSKDFFLIEIIVSNNEYLSRLGFICKVYPFFKNTPYHLEKRSIPLFT